MENHNRLTLILVVLQGDTVAHILFIIVLDYAMRTALRNRFRVYISMQTESKTSSESYFGSQLRR